MSDKTEQPTRKKLTDARKEGRTTKSQDLVEAAALLAMVVTFSVASSYMGDSLTEMVQIALDFVSGDHSLQGLASAFYKVIWAGLGVIVPLTLLAALAAGGALAAQVGIAISFKPVMPKLNSLNPASGLKKIFSAKSVIDLLKMLVKAVLMSFVLWRTIEWLLPLVTSAMYEPLAGLVHLLWTVIVRLLSVTFLMYLVIGAGDWFLQHWMFLKSQRMSKDEIKRERKNQDGDPKVKQERKRLAREFRKSDPRAAIPKANVLIVNPTHYAIAIRYVPSEYALPRVIAKGIDQEAALLRRLAFEENVPIVANPPVARALHAAVGLGSPIPEEMFEVVAAILRWVDGVAANRPAALQTE